MGFSKSSAKREVHTNTSLPQETRETSNINLTLHLKHIEKEEQKPTKLVEEKTLMLGGVGAGGEGDDRR